MPTDRIYYSDCYTRDFEATLAGIAADGAVLLSRTAFYPASGGQEADRGSLAGIDVLSVEEREGEVLHVLAAALPAGLQPGDRVGGVVDWARRYRLMQQHTGQHLLSAVARDLFGWETMGVHIGLAHATVEFDAVDWSKSQLVKLEECANQMIASACPVLIRRGADAEVLPLRKPVEFHDDLRVVSIEGLDHSACGGTHVRSTAEIGSLLLGSTERVRKNLRVEFFCGLLAMERAREQRDTLTEVAAAMHCAWQDSPVMAARRRDELLRLAKQEKAHLRELNQWRGQAARAALTQQRDGPLCALRWVTSGPGDQERAFANAFCEQADTILLTLCTGGVAFMLTCSPNGSFDANAWLSERGASAGARGGGSRTQVSGKVAEPGLLCQLPALLPSTPVQLDDLQASH